MINRWLYLVLLLCGALLCQVATAQITANFTATPTSGCAPIRVVFTDQSSPTPNSWKWDLGNGTTATAQSPSTTYFTPGFYTVKLTVYRGNDSSTIVKTNYISALAGPSVDFTASPQQGCYPLNVTFNDLSNAGSGTITSWQWDFGDGNISNEQNPIHTYLSAGTFNITLTVRNSNGCVQTANKPNLIRVSPGVIAGFTSSSPPTCVVPATVNFTNTSTGAITSYFWSFGDGQTSTQINPSHTYTSAGNYSVSLTVTNASGCSNTFTAVPPLTIGIVDANFNAPNSVCAATAFGLQNTSIPLASLVSSYWDFGDGTTSTAANPVKSYTNPGTYTITYTANFGICQDVTTKTITVIPKPTASFTGTNLGACQPPLTSSFTNTSADGTVVSWNFGDGTSSTAANPTHTYNTVGNFAVTLIIQNANGCIDSLRRPSFVNITPPDIRSITPLPFEGCLPQNVTFTPNIVSPDPVVSYEWDFGDGTTSTLQSPSHNYTVQGAYIIKLKVTTAAGCTDTISYRSGVKVGQKPTAGFTATPRIACAMDFINFSDISVVPPNPDRWFWTFGDGGTSNAQNPSYNYNDTGYFTVTLITWVSGCSDTARIPRYIYIKPPIAAFTDSFDCSNQKLHFFNDRSIGALYYNWTFGDGSSDTVNHNPSHLYADTGRYLVRLRVSDGSCRHESSQTILVLDEKAGFMLGDSLGCASTVKEFRATSNGYNIKNYVWNFGDSTTGFDSASAFIRHRYDSAGTYNVMLKITDLNNCPDSITKPVIVSKYGPKADTGPFQKVCIRSLTTFADSSRADTINRIVRWIWDFGDSTGLQTFTAPPFTHTYTTAGLYSIRLTVVDASGCQDTVYKINNVRVNDPKANFISNDTLVCKGGQVFLADRSQGAIIGRRWDLGDGAASFNLNVGHSYPLEGMYNIKLHVTDDAGCVDSIIKPQFIKVYDARASFAMNDSFTTCPPLFISFTNQSLNAYINNWDFGDNNTSTLFNPSHTYTQSGIFDIKLTITGNGGCKDSMMKQIKILGPTGTFSYTPILGCVPLQVMFNTVARNTFFYTFDFSDGVTQFSPSSTTTHSYALLGNYVPKIILEDSLGCKLPIFGTDTIRVKGIKTFIKGLSTYRVCDSGMVQFNDSTVTNDVIQSYLWDFGDGITSGLQNPTHLYRTSGSYRVTLRVATVTGCVSSDTLLIPIQVVFGPQVAIAGSPSGCVSLLAQFGGQWLNPDTSNVFWQWDFGNGQTSSQQNPPPLFYTAAGQYQITLTARNASGCADTFVQPITVFALPVIDAGPDKSICRGQINTISATGGNTYVWNPHPSLSCTNCSSPLVNPDSSQLYVVRGTDINGCKGTDSVSVIVKQPFVMMVNPGDTLCVGQPVQMLASGAENYLWEPPLFLNRANIPDPVSKPESSVIYQVTGYDNAGCFRDTGYVSIIVYPIPKVNILEDRIAVQVGDPVQLHSTSSNDVTRWRWNPSLNLTCSDCPNPIANARQNISYVLTVSNPGNCTAQDRVTITLLCKEGNIYIPNTFSPNGDGSNDVFYPRGKGIFAIKSMRIFNRWGELVFEKTNFYPNDPTASWDGTYKGKLLTPDVYVYVMDVICDNNTIYNVKGDVTLLR